jgi:hypothetical protein
VLAWVVGLATATSLFVMAARYALPVFDDFCRASFSPTTEIRPARPVHGFGDSLAWSYSHWSGRWAGTALGMLVLGVPPVESAYPWIVTFMLATFVAGSVIAARRHLGPDGWVVAACGWLVYWSAAPGFGEVFLWATTALESHAGLVLAMVVWSVAEAGVGRALLPLLGVGAAVVGGIHELAGVLFVGLLAWRVLYLRAVQRPVPAAILVVAGGAVLGLALHLHAPGNNARSAVFPATGSLPHSVVVAAQLALRSAKRWLLTDLRLWAATLVVLALVVTRANPGAWHRSGTLRDVVWLAVALATTLAAGFWVPPLAIGAEMPLRTQAMLQFTFLGGWFVLVTTFGAWVASSQVIGAPVLDGVRTVALAVLCLSTGAEGNGRVIRRDLSSGALARWHEAQSTRMRLLGGARGSRRDVVLPQVPAAGTLAAVTDSPDPDYAHNLCLEWHYDLARVRTDTTTPPLNGR